MKRIKNTHLKNLSLGCDLALSSGALSAYTYMYHNGVFAGFQTGNIIKLGISIGSATITQDLPFVVSILSFVVGTVLTRSIHYHFDDERFILKRNRLVLLCMLILMLFVAVFTDFVPDLLCIALLSVGAAAQFEEFRTINGIAYTPIMMTGNLRFLIENVFDMFLHPDPLIQKKAKRNVSHISIIMGSYIMGPILVSVAGRFFLKFAIMIPIILCLIAIWIITADIRKSA